jgi:phage gp36-like protein
MVFSKSGEYTGESEDIIKNLFKVLCGIMNFKLQQRGHNQLSEQLLKTYGEAIKFIQDEPNFTNMD